MAKDTESGEVRPTVIKVKGGGGLGSFLKGLLVGVILGAVLMMTVGKGLLVKSPVEQVVDSAHEAVDHVVDQHLTGFTSQDLEDAVLGEATEHQELIVMEQPLQMTSTLKKAGLGDWAVFRKTKTITYYGTGVYTVNFKGLGKRDVSIDEKDLTVTVRIPHAKLQYVNPDYDKIEFEDTEKGFLAFGDLALTAEQQTEIEKNVMEGMEEYLSQKDIMVQADELALKKTWDIFQPIIHAISPLYTVVVEFD